MTTLGLPLMVVTATATVWPLLALKVDGARLDAIRTGGTLGVGLGGVVVLWLAVRRQRSTELDLLQKYEAHRLAERVATHNESVAVDNRAHQQQVAQDAKDDAAERRITELYTKAADQLGSDKAPVRLAGLYALERLAQGNADQRQTIVGLLCGYLRMPYQPAVEPAEESLGSVFLLKHDGRSSQPPADADERTVRAHDDRTQEREVRLTAQRILVDHLRSDSPDGRTHKHWPDVALDLSGATLINFSLARCAIRTASFEAATFVGYTDFSGAVFSGDADFRLARFPTANASVNFEEATFREDAYFMKATFTASAGFARVRFARSAHFEAATFSGVGDFVNAHFAGKVEFSNAIFARSANFAMTHFHSCAYFEQAEFPALHTSFFAAQFAKSAPEEVEQFRMLKAAESASVDGQSDESTP